MTRPGLTLRDMGSFFVGGHQTETTEAPVQDWVLTPNGIPVRIDPNGTTQVGQMYVQYFLPAESQGRLPVLFWHGGSLTGATWETTPDGREGWLTYFLRQGWHSYNVDAVERGRSGWGAARSAFRPSPAASYPAGQLHPVPHRPAGNRWQPAGAHRRGLSGVANSRWSHSRPSCSKSCRAGPQPMT